MANKDLDFDEIDMAVNDHMGLSDSHDTTEEKPANDITPDEDGESDTNHNNADEKTVDLKDTEQRASVKSHLIHSKSAPMTKPPVPHPQVGRFMDVMHPSSLMKKPTQSNKRKKDAKDAETDPNHLIEAGDMPPLLTPFLPDANEKVEKRPLGWSPMQPEDQPPRKETNEAPLNSDNETAEKQYPSHPNEADTVAIHQDTMSSEFEQSQTTKTPEPDNQLQTDPTEVPIEEETEEMKLLKIESQEVSESTVYDSKTDSTVSEAIDPSSALEAEASNSQKNTIYDVNEYHQPLQHPVKQKSGWLTVFIIVMIIALCAGLAATAYFLFFSNL